MSDYSTIESFDKELDKFRHWIKERLRRRYSDGYDVEFQTDLALNRLQQIHRNELNPKEPVILYDGSCI